VNELRFKAAGVSFAKGYPQNLLHVYESGSIHAVLKRQPDNPYDSNAIRIICVAAGGSIGHVPREIAEWLAPIMDSGTKIKASLEEVLVNPEHPNRPGAQIRLAW
jgi:hypothetical protein